MLKPLIRKYPFTAYGIFCLLCAAAIAALSYFGGGYYDDSGIGGVVFLLDLIWSFLAFPFYLSSEMIFAVNDGIGIKGHALLASLLGLSLCGIADGILSLAREHSSRRQA